MKQCPVCSHTDFEIFCRVKGQPAEGPAWEVRRCRKCQLGRTSPFPTEEQIESAYGSDYLGQDTSHAVEEFLQGQLQKSRSWRNEVDKVKLVERYLSSGSILDFGCGEGRFLWALDADRWSPTGVDFLQEVLKQVRDHFPRIRFLSGDLDSLEVPRKSQDAVTFWHSLEHLPQPGAALEWARERLRPGGWLFISLPNLNSLQARLFRQHWYGLDLPRHLFHFSPGSLALVAEQAGFRVEAVHSFSRRVSFHHLKHSLVGFSESALSSRALYYPLKPFLYPAHLLEAWTRRPGVLTLVAQKERA